MTASTIPSVTLVVGLPRLHLQGVPSHHHRTSRIDHDLRPHTPRGATGTGGGGGLWSLVDRRGCL